jgi:hypothetical protein
VDDLNALKKDKNTRLIINKNCQYYIDVDNDRIVYTKQGEYYLPQTTIKVCDEETGICENKVINIEPFAVVEDGIPNITLSSSFRGERYGFSQ